MSDEEYARQLYESDLSSMPTDPIASATDEVRQADERRTERLINPAPELPSISSILASGVEGLSALDEIISNRIQRSSYYDSSNDMFVQMAARRNQEMSEMLNLGDAAQQRNRRGSVGDRVSRGLRTNLSPTPTSTTSSSSQPPSSSNHHSSAISTVSEDEELDRAIAASLPASTIPSSTFPTSNIPSSVPLSIRLDNEDDELTRAIASSLPSTSSEEVPLPSDDELARVIATTRIPSTFSSSSTSTHIPLPDPDDDVELQRALLRALNEQNFEYDGTQPRSSEGIPLSEALSSVDSAQQPTRTLTRTPTLTTGARDTAAAATDDMVSAAIAASMSEQSAQEEAQLQATIAGLETTEDLIEAAIAASLAP